MQLMYVDQKRERAELLHELLKTGAGFDPLPVLTQVRTSPLRHRTYSLGSKIKSVLVF
jgi:hypothetical protein